ncbi:hypothetical protein HHI36_021765 [Cryptolaemus montrouzieri]|uniref:FAM21/CAPZIP domain-containing protein n=1 Tax=Cryptolaemus montrouzieri TaxID=559131 RepID=A0ABD2MXV6_9CUCU
MPLKITTPKASSFAEQLAAKLGKVIKENEGLLEEPEVNKRPIQKKPSDYGALFTDEPPPVDDSLLKDQEPHGIFSGGKGLFDDDDDDDDDNLWRTGKTSIPSTSNINSVVNSKKAPAIRIQSKGLFDDDSDDDIFATTTKTNVKNQIKQPYLQNFKQTAPVFSEEPPLFDEEKNVQIKEKKKPTGGVSVFGNTDIFNTQKIGNILKQKGDDALNESEKDASVQNITKSEPKDTNSRIEESEKIDPKRKTISKVPTPIETRKNSLFEDEDKSFHENANVKTKKKSLFDDDIFGDDLFSNIDTKSSSNLFSDGDLFFVNETATSSKSNMNNSKVAKEKITEKLFEDVEVSPDIKNEYDYSWRKNSKSKIVSLFDDADDDFDIFAPKASDKKLKMVDEEQKPKDSPSKEENTKTTPKVDLFGDDFDDVDDLFSEILRNNSKKASKDLEITKNKQSDSNITKENSIISKKLESQPVESEILEKSAMDLAKEEFSNNSITEEPSGSVMVTKKTAIVSETEEKLDNKLYDDEKGKEEIENEKESDNILGDAVNKSDIFPKEDSPRNESEEASSGNNQPRNSLSVPHVNFLDSVPPPDDGWDNNSDVFDDLEPYSNDGFQSQPSSLFDNEPPSLFFNETSGIMRDHVDQRIDSVNSFDPSLTSSRRLSSDLFSEIQNNDSLFSSKHQGNSSVIGTTQGIPEISDILSEDNTDITPSGNPDDLYSSMSVNVSDKAEILPVISEMNEVSDAEKNSNLTSTEDNEGLQDLERKLVNKPKITEKPKIVKKKPNSEEVLKTDKVASNILQDNEDISPNKVKIISLFDNTFDKDETDDIFTIDTETRQRYTDNDNSKINENIANEICVDKLEQSESDNIEENVLEESADMQSNIARIAGKLQQVSNKNEEKPRAVPRKLSHKLNINVGALLPGSVPPRRDKGQSPEQEPTTSPLRSSKINAEPDNHPPSLVSNKPIPILRTVSESDASRKEYKLEKSVSFDSTTDVEVLQSVTKDRAKIPVKRRPSSRRARQDLLRNSVPNFKLSSDSSANEEIPDIKDAAISRNVKLSETLDKDDKQPLQINNSPQINNRNEEKLERLVQVVDEKLETSATPPISSKENNEKKLDSLFDDERTDQVVDRKQEKIETSETLPIGSKVNIEKKLDSLFDDEDRSVEEVEKLETSGSSTISSRIIIEKKLASLFDDVEDETEDLFKTIEKNVKSVNEAKIISTKKKEDIFSEGEDDFFETLQNTKKNKFTEAIENNFLGTEVKTESPLLFEEGVMDATSIENEDQNISEHNNILYHKEEKLLSKISDITSQEKKNKY